ncbi:MAG: Chemotaxis protein methyltransferase [Candidatus Magnetoglobus multicellularis str. Araruama]|uniref:Chemotaxis protein methyltransferase n=1 Tax=Candidatus Magnetoglobus multicellularis str. Araruama TaxID=890399 RepID=A0A1V1P9F0_9BACT|nr:MAG: Chemotaxis protein methyltransferase [Candidatus Magnetoglobus multicellularis str. Araruama]
MQVKNLQIWSAASSTGEEAVSIAILAEKQWLAMNDRTYFVLATDINPNVLKSLEKGIFKPNSYRVDGSSYHPLMSEFIRTQGRLFSLNENILKNIEICQLNLYMDDMSAWQGRFHLVFLRNMLVYIPLDIRNRILDRLIKNIIDGGYLFLSSSETPLISHPNLKLIEQSGIYFFQKSGLKIKKRVFH